MKAAWTGELDAKSRVRRVRRIGKVALLVLLVLLSLLPLARIGSATLVLILDQIVALGQAYLHSVSTGNTWAAASSAKMRYP